MNFITGNKFKRNCHFSLDETGFHQQKEIISDEIPRFFVKIDLAEKFFQQITHKVPYILYTHNGDLPVDSKYLKYLENPFLIKWYGQNININHPKLKSIPIGIANEIWPHGDEDIINKVINENHSKDNLIYANFDINTNRVERSYCLSEINKKGIKLSEKKDFLNYLRETSKSYFIISPNGNGIDCHKTWESLYLKSIPIVTESINIDFYRNLPILIIKDWADFNLEDLSRDLYYKIWDNFDLNKLSFDEYLK